MPIDGDGANNAKSLFGEGANLQMEVPSGNLYNWININTKMSALEQIRERIKNEPDNLNLLNLSEIKITNFTDEIKKELERFKKVKVLMLRQCDLDNLDNLPNWKLSAVDLSENRFNDDIINKLATIPSLTQILLMECDIRSLDNLKQLGPLKSLQELDFTNCPVTQTPNYRPTLFDSIKSLEVLDQHNLNGEFVADEEDESDESEYNEDEEGSDEEDYEEDEEQESDDKPRKKK